MYVHSLCYIHDELHIGVVVVICSSRNLHIQRQWLSSQMCFAEGLLLAYLNILICHSDVVCVGAKVFRCRHDRELDGALVAKGFVCPFSNGADFLHRGNAVVRDEDLVQTFGQPAIHTK